MNVTGVATAGSLNAAGHHPVLRTRVSLLCLALLCWAGVLGLLHAPEATAAEQFWQYSVRPGDTLMSLAEEFCTGSDHWRRIQQLNQLPADPHRELLPGTRLRFPLDILVHEPATSRVVQLHGTAQLIRAGSSVAEPLVLGTALRSGDRVITGPDSNVTLHFADGSQLLILGDSDVLMDSLSAWSTTGMVDTRLRLQSGRVDTRVEPVRGPGSRYLITTPAAVAAVRGTKFRVAVGAAADRAVMRSEVTGGTVAVQGGDSGTNVVEGYGLVSVAGQAAQAPRVLLPGPRLPTTELTLRALPLRFSWNAVAGASAYRLQIAPDSAFNTLLVDQRVTQTALEWPQLADGEYAMRVRGIDTAGLEGLDTVKNFRVDARPFAPLLSAPPPGSTTRSATPELSWQAQPGIGHYRLQLAKEDSFAQPVLDRTLQQSRFDIDTPLQPGTWYWRVASVDAGNKQGQFSAPASFDYRATLPAPLPGEVQIGDRLLTYSWQAVDGAKDYQLQVATDSEFSNLVHESEAEASHADMRRNGPQRYFYRIRAVDSLGEPGAYSTTRQVDVPPRHYWPLLLLAIPILLL